MKSSRCVLLFVLLLCFILSHSLVCIADSLPTDLSQTQGSSNSDYTVPLFFIPNQGQLDPQVKYYMHAGDRVFYFTSHYVVITFREPQPSAIGRPQAVSLSGEQDNAARYWAVQLEFVGANKTVVPRNSRPMPTQISYFKGSPDQWRGAIPTCAELVYEKLWPGVDLIFTAEQGQLKYTFIVHPDSDPDQIRLAYRGATISAIDSGQLKVSTPFGGLVDQAPIVWQDTKEGRRFVPCTYNFIKSSNSESSEYGFDVKPYDPTLPLVLDPGFTVYSGLIGGSDNDYGSGIAVDAAGNAYVSGTTWSADFPRNVGLAHAGGSDVFVAKVRSDGTALVYCGFIGGSGDDYGSGIAVDAAGNAYVTGYTWSTDFPRNVGLAYAGLRDVFVAKVLPDGTALVFSGFIGGSGDDLGTGIAVDAAGNAYVTGYTDSTNFPRNVGLAHAGGKDVFVAKVQLDGTALEYSGFIGGSGDDWGTGIAVDAAGNAYVTGYTDSTDFPRNVGLAHAGGKDVFVAKVQPDGTALVFSGFIGGSGDDNAYGIAVDAAGNAYVTGYTDSTDFPRTAGPAHAGGTEVFAAKVLPDGTALEYSRFIGGSDNDNAYGIAVDAAGNAYVAGATASTDFPRTVGPAYAGGGDVFVTKVRSDGSALEYSGFIGGSDSDWGTGIAVDAAGNAYVTGYTWSTDFPRNVGLAHAGFYDAIVVKVRPSVSLPWIPLLLLDE